MDWTKVIFDSIFVGLNSFLVLRLTRHIDNSTKEIKSLHERVDVHDRITSNIIGQNFDSHAVARSGKFPRIKPLRDS